MLIFQKKRSSLNPNIRFLQMWSQNPSVTLAFHVVDQAYCRCRGLVSSKIFCKINKPHQHKMSISTSFVKFEFSVQFLNLFVPSIEFSSLQLYPFGVRYFAVFSYKPYKHKYKILTTQQWLYVLVQLAQLAVSVWQKEIQELDQYKLGH